jgi:hypothetical protein
MNWTETQKPMTQTIKAKDMASRKFKRRAYPTDDLLVPVGSRGMAAAIE